MGNPFCFTFAFCKFPRRFARGILFSTCLPFLSTPCVSYGKIVWFTYSCLLSVSIIYLLHRKIYFYLRLPFVSILHLLHEKNVCLLCFPFASLLYLLQRKNHFILYFPFASHHHLLREKIPSLPFV